MTPGPLLIPNGYVATLDNTQICAVLGEDPTAKCEGVPANDDPKDDGSELAESWKNAATRRPRYDWCSNYQGPERLDVGVNIGTARGLAGEIYRDHELRRRAGVGGRRPTGLTCVAHEVLASFRSSAPARAGTPRAASPGPRTSPSRLQTSAWILGAMDRGVPRTTPAAPRRRRRSAFFQDTSKTEFYDFMSYCAQSNDGDPTPGSRPAIGKRCSSSCGEDPPIPRASAHAASRPRAVTAAAAPRTLEVTAYAAAGGVGVTACGPRDRAAALPPGAAASRLWGANAAGAVVATAPLEATGDSEAAINCCRTATGSQPHQGRDRRWRNGSRRRPQCERSPVRVRRPRHRQGTGDDPLDGHRPRPRLPRA